MTVSAWKSEIPSAVELIKALEPENEQEIEHFHSVAVFRNLHRAAVFWVGLDDKSKYKHSIELAKQSASILGMNDLLTEIKEKLEDFYDSCAQ